MFSLLVDKIVLTVVSETKSKQWAYVRRLCQERGASHFPNSRLHTAASFVVIIITFSARHYAAVTSSQEFHFGNSNGGTSNINQRTFDKFGNGQTPSINQNTSHKRLAQLSANAYDNGSGKENTETTKTTNISETTPPTKLQETRESKTTTEKRKEKKVVGR